MKHLNGGLNALFVVFLFSIRRTAMIKKLTIYMFVSFFVMSLVSSAVAKITDVMMYNYKLLEDDWDHSVASCPSGSSETPPKEGETCTQFKDISGLTCYKDCKCKSNYVKVNGVCTLNDCSAYPLTGCDDNRGYWYPCPTDNSRCVYTSCKNGFSFDSNKNCACTGTGAKTYSVGGIAVGCICDSSTGYEGTPPNCTAKACTGDYSATVTSCDTDYTLSCSGYSGGKKCCKCTCTADATCTATNYPLTSKPSNANYKECTPGCGDNTKRYAITSCHDGYELSGNACVAKQPEGFQCCISDNNSSYSYNQFSLIGRYNSAKDQYDGCETGGWTHGIDGIDWTNSYSSMCGGISCYYYSAEDYDTFKYWMEKASTSINVYTMVMGVCGDIDATEDIIITNNNFTIDLMPCPVEYGTDPRSYTISSLNNSIELEHYASSVSINYSTPVLIINNGGSLYNSLIKADKIYLKGKVFFDNVKIEPLYSDHVDIYVGSNDDEGYNCYANSYLDDGDGYIIAEAEHCAPVIGFYSSWPGYQYRRYDNGYYYYASSTAPSYSNVWGTPDKPVIFHKEYDNTLDGIMFSESTEGVTIYGYNGDSSPVFSEFVIRNYVDAGYGLPTYQFNLKNYVSNTVSPLFRRFQTGAPNNEANAAWRGYAELNIYKDLVTSSSDNTKVTSAVNEIKNNSYLTSGETCTLGSASSYVYTRDYDTTDCGVLSCEYAGLASEEEYYDLIYTPVTTACDGKMGTDTEKCYKVSYPYCMWGEGEDSDPDEIAYYGDCASEIGNYAIDQDAYYYACAEITNEDPMTICETFRDRYINDLGFDDVGPTLNYSTVDYQTDVYGNTNSSGSKCLVCNFGEL